jgi:hypothetical protein
MEAKTQQEQFEDFAKGHFPGIEKETWYPAIGAIGMGFADQQCKAKDEELREANRYIVKLQQDNLKFIGVERRAKELYDELEMAAKEIKLLKNALKRNEFKADELAKALELIAEWKLPETGRFWDEENTRPLTYEAAYGSNGVRDYMKSMAKEALESHKSNT